MFFKIDVIILPKADFFNAVIFSETPNVKTCKIYMFVPAHF